MFYKHGYQDCSSNSDRKPEYVYERVKLLSGKISKGYSKMVPDHDSKELSVFGLYYLLDKKILSLVTVNDSINAAMLLLFDNKLRFLF